MLKVGLTSINQSIKSVKSVNNESGQFSSCQGVSLPYDSFLAPLAEGQQAIVMALCPSCVRPSVRPCMRASVNSSFKKLLLRNY